jgi:hypothetical protein
LLDKMTLSSYEVNSFFDSVDHGAYVANAVSRSYGGILRVGLYYHTPASSIPGHLSLPIRTNFTSNLRDEKLFNIIIFAYRLQMIIIELLFVWLNFKAASLSCEHALTFVLLSMELVKCCYCDITASHTLNRKYFNFS